MVNGTFENDIFDYSFLFSQSQVLTAAPVTKMKVAAQTLVSKHDTGDDFRK